MGQIVGRWFNGQWGRARKDIWLEQLPDGRVEVRWRDGGDFRDGGSRIADDLEHARSAAQWLREHGDPNDRWVDWTGLYQSQPSS